MIPLFFRDQALLGGHNDVVAKGVRDMAKKAFPMIVLPGFAAILAVGAGLVHAASVEPAPAYGAQAAQLEAAAVASTAQAVFSRADLDNDGELTRDEFVTLSVVTAELGRLNGFIAVDYAAGVRTAALPRTASWSGDERARVEDAARRDYAAIAGEDERMTSEEFVTARLEAMAAADLDRNGVLVGAELTRYAAIEARVISRQS